MAQLYEWEDEYKDGEFRLSVLWLIKDEMAVIVSGSSIFSNHGSFTVVCPQLLIQHEGLKSSTVDSAKAEAINLLAARLTKYGNGVRGYMAKVKGTETKK